MLSSLPFEDRLFSPDSRAIGLNSHIDRTSTSTTPTPTPHPLIAYKRCFSTMTTISSRNNNKQNDKSNRIETKTSTNQKINANTIINPGPMDILSGRGSGATQHAGNQDYLSVINMNKAAAKSMSVKEKKQLVQKLYRWFSSSGYRFLKQTRKTGNHVEYTELRPVQAKDKIRQALNDKERATVFPTLFPTIAPVNPRSTFWSERRAQWPGMHPNTGSENQRHGTGSFGYENGDRNLNRTLPFPHERPQDLLEPTPLGSLLNDTHANKITPIADRLVDDNDSMESVDDDQILSKFRSLAEDLFGATECRKFIAEIELIPQDEEDLWWN